MKRFTFDWQGLKHRVLSHGRPGTGKTHFLATWPKVVSFHPRAEGGATTIATMDRNDFYDPNNPPTTWEVESLADIKQIPAVAAKAVADGAETIGIDTVTFLALILDREITAPGKQKYGEMLNILTDLRDKLHALDAHVIWTAGTAEDNKVLIMGKTADYLAHSSTFLFCHEAKVRNGETEYLVHTNPSGGYLARNRLGSTLTSPLCMYVENGETGEFERLNSPTYRAIEQALELKAS